MASAESRTGGNGFKVNKTDDEHLKISATKINIVLFMTLFIDLLGFTVILPLMPKLLEFYGKDGSVSKMNC